MKIDYLNILSKLFTILISCLFCVLIISIIANIIEYSNLPFSLKSGAISKFIKINSTPINIGTAFFASLAIWLTIARMKQTSTQINEITKNNRFNNFFTHRKEFKEEFLTNQFFLELSHLTKRDIPFEIGLLYNIFYYKSPNVFKPYINTDSKKKIIDFLDLIKNSDLDKEGYDLENYDNQKLYEISKNNFRQVKSLITSIHSKLTPSMRKAAKDSGDDVKPDISKFIYLNEFYWSGILYQSLLQFDGSSDRIWENFDINFINFREKLYYSEGKISVTEELHNQPLKPNAVVGGREVVK